MSFAEQIEQDIPDSCLFIKPDNWQDRPQASVSLDRAYFSDQQKKKTDIGKTQLSWDKERLEKPSIITAYSASSGQLNLGNFRERVIAAFQ